MQKYKLIEDQVIEFEYHKLYRIEAVRDFGRIKKGQRGGYIENEKNLSHEGDCWIHDDAKVYDQAEVSGNARIMDNVQICEHAKVYGYAEILDNVQIYGNACISNKSLVHGSAQVYGDTKVFGNAQVYQEARIYGDAEVGYQAEIKGHAEISKNGDYYVGKNIWSSGRYFTYTRSNRMWAVGCFYGTSTELIDKANLDTLVSGREYERIVNYVEAMYNDLEND